MMRTPRRGPAAWLVCLFLMVPTIIVVPMSFGPDRQLQFPPRGLTLHWYAEYLQAATGSRRPSSASRRASLLAVCATVIGTMVALALVRGRPPGRGG